MREIKFRCWDTENKQMLKVQELDFEDTFYGGRLSIRADMYNDYFDIEDMILMQYTGLKDKNGKEIYEGDIVKLGTYTKGVVEYSDKYAQFIIINTNTIEYEYEPLGDYTKIEIIGNKWDNPELLEKGE